MMVFGLVTVTGAMISPASAAGVRCTDRGVTSDIDWDNDGSPEPDDWKTVLTLRYRYCYNPSGNDWVKPLSATFFYNKEGSRMDCYHFLTSGWNDFKKVHVNGIMYDNFGRTYNPGVFYVPCDESTINSRTQRYDQLARRLYWNEKKGVSPRWKYDWWGETQGGFYQPKGVLHNTFHRVSL